MESLKPGATFKKEERLVSRKAIAALIGGGSTLSASPLRLVWIASDDGAYPARIAFAVPKKNFPSAVDRNRVKRQMREVYRKNKSALYALLNRSSLKASLMLVYSGRQKPEYAELEKKFQ